MDKQNKVKYYKEVPKLALNQDQYIQQNYSTVFTERTNNTQLLEK